MAEGGYLDLILASYYRPHPTSFRDFTHQTNPRYLQMAGVKGRSGGARPNTGGVRPGAGRKPLNKDSGFDVSMEAQAHGGALKRASATPIELPDMDMLTLLQQIALGRLDASDRQLRAAIAAVQYTHSKKAEGGKKEEKEESAKAAGKGKFAAAQAPRLVSSSLQ